MPQIFFFEVKIMIALVLEDVLFLCLSFHFRIRTFTGSTHSSGFSLQSWRKDLWWNFTSVGSCGVIPLNDMNGRIIPEVVVILLL